MNPESDIVAEIAKLSVKIDMLKEIVVGEDGEGGLRRDLKHLTSLRDKGLGVLLVLGLVVTTLGSTIREWLSHMFNPPPGH